MQKPHLELNEITWEISDRCNNNCSYCGTKCSSTDNISEADNSKIIKIAENIAKHPPKKVCISGGDPLLVSPSVHSVIAEIFRNVEIKTSIIVNPLSWRTNNRFRTHKENEHILGEYDKIGMSVNTKEELEEAKSVIGYFYDFNKNIVIITNFNTSNIFLINKIADFIIKSDLPSKTWQVQFTIYKDRTNPLAIYNNEEALKYLNEQLNNHKDKILIIVADNANTCDCSAGKNSCGILSDGYVIPCLSQLSWLRNDEINDRKALNILETPLGVIWNSYDYNRFESFECCKDACNNKQIVLKEEDAFITTSTPTITDRSTWKWNKGNAPYYPNQNQVLVYAVFSPDDSGTPYSTGTTSHTVLEPGKK